MSTQEKLTTKQWVRAWIKKHRKALERLAKKCYKDSNELT